MEKKQIKISLGTFIAIIVAIILVVVVVFMGIHIANQNKQIEESKVAVANNETNEQTKLSTKENIKDYFLLYSGYAIENKVGFQYLGYIPMNNDNVKKYGTTYYNYENGKYVGETKGYLEEVPERGENDSILAFVENVSEIATTQYYNAIPRSFSRTNKLPQELNYMGNYSSVNIDSIDLDNDGKKENVVCWTLNYAKGERGNSEPQASSGIMLFDANYNKVADLVTLENGFWANIKEESNKILLSLDEDIDYFDIDNDGIMELLIRVPWYGGDNLSIVKYSKGKIEGDINYQASVE